jgi:hypothetical protein
MLFQSGESLNMLLLRSLRIIRFWFFYIDVSPTAFPRSAIVQPSKSSLAAIPDAAHEVVDADDVALRAATAWE